MKEKRQILLEEQCQQILNEAYFGKHPLLREVETQMDIITKKVKRNPLYDVTTSKENKIIMQNMEKLFNVESFSLVWSSDFSNSNGYTVTLSHIMQFKNDLKTVKTSNGIRFAKSKGLHMVVVLQTGLILTGGLNPSQLTAVLLHEIGHNFYNTKFTVFMNKYFSFLQVFLELIQKLIKFDLKEFKNYLLKLPVISLKSNNVRKVLNKLIRDKNKIYSGSTVLLTLVKGFIDLTFQAASILAMFLTLPTYYAKKVVRTFNFLPNTILEMFMESLFKTYEQERFSDTFASMYGYSKEIVEVRSKFDSRANTFMVEKGLSKIPVFGSLVLIYQESFNAVNRFSSYYDNGRTSAQSQIEYIRNELNKENINPKLRKELEEQIVLLEKLYDVSVSTRHNLESGNVIRLVLFKIFGETCFAKTSINKEINRVSYTLSGKKFDASFEDILDGNQVY